MNWMSVIRAGALTLACGFSSAVLWAQTKPASRAEAGSKGAAINMRLAIANTAEGKQASAQLQTEFQSRRKEIEDLNKKITDLQQRLHGGASRLNDEMKQQVAAEGQKLGRKL